MSAIVKMGTDAWSSYVYHAAIFNLQILPETLMCGIIILSILLANQPLVAVAAGIGITQILTQTIGRLVMGRAPSAGTPRSSLDPCSTGFVGKSWARLTGSDTALMWHPLAPSIYLSTIGFFAGWGTALHQIYKDEIDAGIVQRPALVATMVVSAFIVLLAFAFRVYSGCESLLGASTGLAIGLLFGFLGCIALSYATERKGTNIWGIPLLRKRNKHRQ